MQLFGRNEFISMKRPKGKRAIKQIGITETCCWHLMHFTAGARTELLTEIIVYLNQSSFLRIQNSLITKDICHVLPAQGSWWRMTFDDVIFASSVYVIPTFACDIKGPANIVWGSFFQNSSETGSGSDLDLGVTYNSRFRSEYRCTLLFGSPSPWQLWFIHCVLSIVFCVTCNLQPVCIQVGLGWLILECMLGPKAPHQE